MSKQSHQAADLSRQRFLKNTAAALAAASTVGFGVGKSKATEASLASASRIPDLAPQRKDTFVKLLQQGPESRKA